MRPPPEPEPQPLSDPLDQAILYFDANDPFTIRDACEGVQIFGGIGSGKTSGSGAQLAAAFLNAGFGGLVLTAKPDETDLWRRYVAKAGRSADLILFGQEHAARFNALEYERTRPGRGAGLTENLVELFDELGQMDRKSEGNGIQDGSFWRTEQRKLVRNAIEALSLAGMAVSFPNINQVIQSAPRSEKQLTDEEWLDTSYLCDVLREATERKEAEEFSDSQLNDFKVCREYWHRDFPRLPDRVRAIAMAMYSGVGDVFVRGLLRQLFSESTTVTPEDTFAGKIIVLDLPQKQFNEVGVFAQVLFKYCWQRAVERRKIERDSRPLFLWIDESQHFVNKHDVGFQTTSRSARVATVLLTQNLPNYYAVMGGEHASKALVDSLLGNLTTKIFHNNTCAITNQYAADLFARDWRQIPSSSISQAEGKFTTGSSQAAHLEHTVLPREFTGLAKGGPPHDFTVEAIIHQGGKVFQCSGSNALKTTFRQET